MGKKNNSHVWEIIARKLTSRKLWLSVAAFVTGLIVLCGGNDVTAEKIGGAIMSGAAVIAYAIGEGLADNDNKKDKK